MENLDAQIMCLYVYINKYIYMHTHIFLLGKQLTALINCFHSEIIITLARICAHTQRDGDDRLSK